MARKWMQEASDEMKKKGTEGAFSSWAHDKDMSTREAASKVMANKDDYPDSRVKQANFAKNAMGASAHHRFREMAKKRKSSRS